MPISDNLTHSQLLDSYVRRNRHLPRRVVKALSRYRASSGGAPDLRSLQSLANILDRSGHSSLIHSLIDDDVLGALARLNIVPGPSTVLGVDFTSKCNLRCVYCFQSQQPDYYYRKESVSLDINNDLVDAIIKIARQWNVGRILVGFAGETTILPKWTEYLTSLIDTGIPLTLTTNLAKLLQRDEASVLARCDQLQVSVDAVDPHLAKKIRRGSDIRTIVYNIMLIRSTAGLLGIREPSISLYVVVSDKSVFDLAHVFAFAASANISKIALMGLDTTYTAHFDPTLGQIPVFDIADLEPERKMSAVQALKSALSFAEKAGIDVWMNSGVEKLMLPDRHSAPERPVTKHVPDGWTRACMQPWVQPMVKADGGLEPCCHGYGEVARMASDGQFAKLFNTDGMKAVRMQLLSGKLSDICRGCSLPNPIRPLDFAVQVLRSLDLSSGEAAAVRSFAVRGNLLFRIRHRVHLRRVSGQSWAEIAGEGVRRVLKSLKTRISMASDAHA